MPIAAIFAEEAALALASELAPYAAGEAALAASSLLGAEALMGLGAEALGTSAIGGAEALAASEAMAANAASGGAGAGAANINAAQVAAQQNAAMQLANPGITGIPDPNAVASVVAPPPPATPFTPASAPAPAFAPTSAPYTPLEITNNPANAPFPEYFNTQAVTPPSVNTMGLNMPGAYVPEPMYSGMGMESQIAANQFIEPGSGSLLSVPPPPPSALEAGMDKAVKFAKANPFTAMTGAYMGASALGLLNPSGATFNNAPYDGPLSRYKLSPNFQGSTVNPAAFQYTPKRYAGGGGIMGAESYDIPVGYDEGGPVALPLPSRTMRSSDAFQVPGQPQDPSQFAAADAYNDILRNRVIADTSTNRLNDANLGYYQATPNELANTAGNTKFGFSSTMAQKELANRSNEGEFAVPGYGDLGQFAGGGNDNYASRFGGSASFNALKDDNPYNVDAFAKGGSLSDSITEYQKMLSGQPQAAPAASRDVGIYYDQDPDTRYQDALTAAQIRQAKVNQRAYVSAPAAKRPTPLGKLNLPTSAKSKDSGDVEAASGGIMQSSLGGYAAGGNPRLLKGPGDGMSDNIPATINGRQPARLADGEFVIPADVVSHLGNGSTEAGAKHLHAMMNKVRKARTGNPKQGKQIKPQKYMPK
jgi:hypothetical protein